MNATQEPQPEIIAIFVVQTSNNSNMELKQFITEVLTQIAEGVQESDKVFKDKNGIVAPPLGNGPVSGDVTYYRSGGSVTATAIPLCNVKFEVSLSNTNSEDKGGGIGVNLGIITGKGGKGVNELSESLTRVSFTIPYVLPVRK